MDTSNIPEIWGGIECSFNRVQNAYVDQLDYCGHYKRGIEDIRYIAELGFQTVRYPAIWERHKPEQDNDISWTWLQRQLNTLRYYNITPIAGLVHHGSGPIHASLLDPHFASEIEKYSYQVAQKFPWLEYYTPVNEPLTTARFCGLYSFWYPHKRNAKCFAEMLLNEIKAIVLSMRAIRKINPRAKLIQTEDLGKTYSTQLLRYQADFENERRWLTNDLLCGFVKPGHAMWDYFMWLGIPQKSLDFFLEKNLCHPAIIGLDYYLTSERFLDETPGKFPSNVYGSNGKHQYADIEAIRVKHLEESGPEILLRECWNRYNIPMAVTEVHINGTPEDQIRWFGQIWDTCLYLKQSGINIKAVTAWAIFGSFGWSKLLTESPGEYERGVYDVKSGHLVSTAYTSYVKNLIRNPFIHHPALESQGWWQQDERLYPKE